MTALVSVVVPVFNGMPHLRDLTESILAQSYQNLDIVFTEGGSTDDSLDYLATITDPRVRVITMPQGTTAAQNWTAASKAARGELVKLVCQDDLLKPEAIAKQAADLTARPDAVMAIAQRDIIDAQGDVLYAKRGCARLDAGLVPGSTALMTCYTQGTNVFGEPLAVLFRRDALTSALPWDDTDPFMLDLATYTKIAREGDVFVRKESIGAFRVSTSSWSHRLAKEQVQQYERWQKAFAASLRTPPTVLQRARAKAGLHTQALLRRTAYRWLGLKGSLRSQG